MISTVRNPETKNTVIFVDLDHKQKILGSWSGSKGILLPLY
jgi:hypothetical protein